MANITGTQYELLKLLAKTGYITNSLIAQKGITRATSSNHYSTNRLLDSKYIGRVMIASSFGIGRKVLYYITKKGAELVAEIEGVELENLVYTTLHGGIQTTKNGQDVSVMRNDFTHKERYISFFIALDMYLENTNYTIEKTYHYYQRRNETGTNLIVNGKPFRPDGIFFVEPLHPKQPLFCYVAELHRHSNRKKIIKQLLQHAQAIEQRAIENRFGIETPYFVFSIFADENAAVMRGVIDELQDFPEWGIIKDFFLFGKLEDVKENFYNGLVYFGGNKKPVPPKT